MNNVLIVDDEKSLLLSLEAGLQSFKDEFSVITAENGKLAMAVLERTSIDLVISDLRMPEMDGFELLAFLHSHYPSIPVIVMTAYATTETERKIHALSAIPIIEKPVDFDELIHTILENLEVKNKGGIVTGISLPNFMDLIEKEEKTCLLEIQKNTKKLGFLFFNKGKIWDAICGRVKGEDAVFRLLSRDDVQISFRDLPKRKIKRRIKSNLMSLLLESARRIDEKNADTKNTMAAETALSPTKNDSSFHSVIPLTDKDKIHTLPSIDDTDQTQDLSNSSNSPTTKGEKEMSKMEEILEKLREIEGFQAAGVFSPQGEMVSQVNASGLEIAELGALANDVLLKAQKATEIMGVGRGQLVHIEAPKAHLITRCLNEATDFAASSEGRAHLHMVLALKKEGNLAMGKMKLQSIIQELAPMFR